jgi:hypothetical protein
MGIANSQVIAAEWVSFPGGELEGVRPKALCPACRDELKRAAASAKAYRPKTLCFQCYRAELDRERALKAAGELDTASVERFQTTLPFEPVDRVRLTMLKADRAVARETERQGTGRFVDKRRQAQMAARRALQRIFAGVSARGVASTAVGGALIAAATHAAELQLPEAWLPFVVSR